MPNHPLEPADLLRPISVAVKTVGAPILQNSRDHGHFQHLLVQQLAPICRDLQEPLRQMSFAIPYLDRTATEDLYAIAKELSRISDSMASPAWWKRAVFWKLTDGRPVLKRLVSDLLAAASTGRRAQPQFKQWKDSKPHPDFIGVLDPERLKQAEKFWARVADMQKLERELESQFDAAKTSLEEADKFFHAWLRGAGFVSKPKGGEDAQI